MRAVFLSSAVQVVSSRREVEERTHREAVSQSQLVQHLLQHGPSPILAHKLLQRPHRDAAVGLVYCSQESLLIGVPLSREGRQSRFSSLDGPNFD